MKPQTITRFFDHLAEADPTPETELDYVNDYTLLVAVVLSANVVLNVAFGEETFAVDTHVFRVSNRTGLAPGKTPLAVELKLEKAIPAPYRRHAHHWLILLGRHTCKARKPECWHCPVVSECAYDAKTTA